MEGYIPTNTRLQSSPWGKVQSQHDYAEGVVAVSTAGHGGLKVYREQNAKIPAIFRAKGGWYEEDCEAAIPAFFLTDVFPPEKHRESAEKSLRQWHWRQYEAHFGVTIPEGENSMKDRELFNEANPEAWVSAAAWGDWHDLVPTGTVGLSCHRAGDEARAGETRYVLVPKEAYKARGAWFLIPDDAQEWCGPRGAK